MSGSGSFEQPPFDPLRAGRSTISPSSPNETLSESLSRFKAEFDRLTLDPASVLEGAETAQETFKRFLKEDLAPPLRALGFRGSGTHYRLDRGDFRGALGFQKNRHSTRAVVEFTINVGAAHLPTKRTYWSARIGHLMPGYGNFSWWRLPHGAATDELLDDVVGAIRNYALIALEAVLHEPEVPPEAGRTWPRRFGPDPVALPRTPSPILPLDPSSRFDADDAFTELDSSDFYKRFKAMEFIYRHAPDDYRTVPALMAVLEQEPRTYTRAVAAMFLAFVPSDYDAAERSLRLAAAEDEDLEVRLYARYALALRKSQSNCFLR